MRRTLAAESGATSRCTFWVFGPRAHAGPSQTSALAAHTHLDRAGAGWIMTFESDRFHEAARQSTPCIAGSTLGAG
jgi:hypothetical protein